MKHNRQAPRLAGKASPVDHSRGSPLAKTTLVAYGDFASPACSQTYRTVKEIQKKMGTTLRYVYRSFPQPEQSLHSEEAAEAAECASSQGKFWEMHDSMFESDSGRGIPLSQCAEEAGLDLLRFRREMQAHVHGERVRSVRAGGVRSGVETAPAFFINSVRHESSFGLATLLAAVQAASGGEPTKSGPFGNRKNMSDARKRRGRYPVLMTIGIVLLVLWALGLFAFHVTTGVIHVLIVLAVIAIGMHLVRGNRSLA